MFIQQKRTAKFGLLLNRIFKKTVHRHPNSYRLHRTHGTSGTGLNLTVCIDIIGVCTCPIPTLPNPALSDGIPDSHSAALRMDFHHIARLRTTHAHSVSIATTQAGRAGKARNRSARVRAAWACADGWAGGQHLGAQCGNGSPALEQEPSENLCAARKRLYPQQHSCGGVGWARI